jgi:hypothetical protein
VLRLAGYNNGISGLSRQPTSLVLLCYKMLVLNHLTE